MQPSAPAAPITSSAQALAALNQQQAGQKTPDQAFQDASSAAGIPQQQQQVTGLRGAIQNTQNLLTQVAPSVMGRTANSLVTSAQAGAIINNEQAPLNTQLDKENTDYSNANSDLNTATSQADQEAQAVLSGQTSQESALSDLYKTLSANEANSAQQAEAVRQFNATLAEKTATDRASTASPSLVGGSTAPTSVGKMTTNAAGGYGFSNQAGQPITMAQYVTDNGGSLQNIVSLLNESKSPSDHAIASAVASNNFSSTQLRKMYPQVFGGTY